MDIYDGSGVPDKACSIDIGNLEYLHEAIKDTVGKDNVKNPSHYKLLGGIEAIEVIASTLTEEAFYGYCLGNQLKYKLRAGGKDNVEQELNKAQFYEVLFERHKHLCKKEGKL